MPSVCRTVVRRRLFKARVVGSKLRLGRGFETHGLAGIKPSTQSYRTSLFACRRMPSLNRSHVTHLHGGSPYDLTPTHYGIGSETPNLKPTGFKSKRAAQALPDEPTRAGNGPPVRVPELPNHRTSSRARGHPPCRALFTEKNLLCTYLFIPQHTRDTVADPPRPP